jgi:RimJ/RimL family protein N-acetyltransferase
MACQAQPLLGLDGGLRLRPWAIADADALVAAAADPDIRRWNLLSVQTLDDARARITRMHDRWAAETGAIWAVAELDSDAAIGLAGLNDIALDHGSAEILYWLLPAARGRGAAVEATARLTRWAFEEVGLHRLRLCHSVHNPASCRVAAKAGFALEGTMRSELLHEDGWHDQHLHARIAGDD